ncbi:MAG: hypothetical protein ACRC1P_09790 [Cellulosilyticaceae bacterium]
MGEAKNKYHEIGNPVHTVRNRARESAINDVIMAVYISLLVFLPMVGYMVNWNWDYIVKSFGLIGAGSVGLIFVGLFLGRNK